MRTGTSEVFWHLTDEEVEERLSKYMANGMTEEEAFEEIYAEDCNMDEFEINVNNFDRFICG